MVRNVVAVIAAAALALVVFYYSSSPVHREVPGESATVPGPLPQEQSAVVETNQGEWDGPTAPMQIGTVAVAASIARTPAERVQGLSGTPFLPEDVVKLFVFDEPGAHGIWMKDMRYPIDIAWVDEGGIIVHVEASVDPATYPTSFSSPVPALYVIEANAGFFTQNEITVGSAVVLPSGL